MRIIVLALAATAVAQPALARDSSQHHRRSADRHYSGGSERIHHGARHYGHRRHAVSARYVRAADPYAQGFAAPFAEPYGQPFGWQAQPRVSRRAVRAREGVAQGFAAPFGQPFGWEGEPRGRASSSYGAIDSMIAQHASAAGVPVELARRVVARESGGNPRAVSKGNYGLMQIRLGTARAMGYTGSAAGLLDPSVNMTYAMRYLAGAYRAAGGNPGRAVANYQRGYYYQAKAQGFSPYASAGGLRRAVGRQLRSGPASCVLRIRRLIQRRQWRAGRAPARSLSAVAALPSSWPGASRP